MDIVDTIAQPSSDAVAKNSDCSTSQTRFCVYHQGHAKAAGGQYVIRRNTKRWMCGRCVDLRQKARTTGDSTR